jgi:hypothetical protein
MTDDNHAGSREIKVVLSEECPIYASWNMERGFPGNERVVDPAITRGCVPVLRLGSKSPQSRTTLLNAIPKDCIVTDPTSPGWRAECCPPYTFSIFLPRVPTWDRRRLTKRGSPRCIQGQDRRTKDWD